MMAATIRDVAKEANVSVRTATRVVNNKPNVRPQTRQLVNDAIARLGWRPNAHARHLVRGKTEHLGVILPDSRNTVFSDIAAAIEMQATTHGYDCLFLHSEGLAEREAKFLNLALDGTVDGLIVMPHFIQANHAIYKRLIESQIPLVFRGGPEILKVVDLVTVDLRKAGYLATRHLLNMGHEHVGMILYDVALQRRNGRLAGYKDAHEEKGLPIRQKYIVHCGQRLEEGYHAIRRLLEMQPQITALFCHNDQTALAALRAGREMGRRIPEDLALVGYDNIEMGRFCEAPLTTINFPKELLGQLLVDMLFQRMHNPDHPSQRVVLTPELIIRKSCGYEAHQ